MTLYLPTFEETIFNDYISKLKKWEYLSIDLNWQLSKDDIR